MKLVSWNVNGLRACVNKGFNDYFAATDADIFCLQETKLQEGQISLACGGGYFQYWNYAVKKGYSGTAVFTKIKPLSVRYGLEEEEEPEGRIITLEFDAFYLVNTYTPNARRDLSRLEYRLEWEDRFRSFLERLDAQKPVIICGDLNVAHQEIDIKNAKSNRNNSGFTPEERYKMTQLLDAGFVDTFRYFYPDRADAYTWWSNMPKVRERNVGWRIDYFLVSSRLAPSLLDAQIDAHITGSDHCPVILQVADISMADGADPLGLRDSNYKKKGGEVMVHAFIIEPNTYHTFENEAALIEKCKEWGLLSEKASKAKAFFYKGNGMNLACSIIGFVDKMTAVIEFDNGQKHCIHPSYLKEMQASNYGQRITLSAEGSVEQQSPELEKLQEEVEQVQVEQEEVEQVEEAKFEELKPEAPKVEEPSKGKAKKEKAPKIELPEGKVTMTATVMEFTTVPNNFSDNDDEVVIYDAVTITEPHTEIGTAWSSHSATLKKLELEIGDTITFEAKIVAKKLTRHPVAYKINNPAKLQKQQS